MQRKSWSPEAAPTFWINHASRLLIREFEKVLRPLDFGFAYMPVLGALLRSDEPMQQKHLAEIANVEQPTMAALLTRMERDGLIERTPHPEDKRASHIEVTRKAKARVEKGRDALRSVAGRALEGFSESERATLRSMLERVVKNLS